MKLTSSSLNDERAQYTKSGEFVKYTFLALSLSFSFSSMAATSATLLLKGSIAPILNIAVTPELIASSLDLTATQSNTKVATVQEKSNSYTGYKVSIASQNLGVLKNSQHSFAYTLSYDGTPLNLSSTVNQVNSSSAAVTVNKNVNISYSGVPAAQLVAGDYSDVVTFTIAVN